MAKWGMIKASTPAQYVLILIDMAESQGCDRRALLAGTSLAHSGIAGIGARVSDRASASNRSWRWSSGGTAAPVRLGVSAPCSGRVTRVWFTPEPERCPAR